MMSSNNDVNVTSPGGSDILQEATSSCQQGSTMGSKNDLKTFDVPSQASRGTHVGVKLCDPLEHGNGLPGDAITKTTKTLTDRLLESQQTRDENPFRSSLRVMRKCLSTQDDGLKLLDQKARSLENLSARVRSLDVKNVIEEMLAVIEGFRKSRDAVHRAFNVLAEKIGHSSDQPLVRAASKPSGRNASTQTLASNTDDRSSTILSAIAEVKDIMARTDEKVAKQQVQIEELGRLQEAANCRVKKVVTFDDGDVKRRPETSANQESRKKNRTKVNISEPVSGNKVKSGNAGDEGFQVVRRSKDRKPDKKAVEHPKGPTEAVAAAQIGDNRKRRRLPKHQAVIIEKPPDISSYADMVRSVKAAVQQEGVECSITTRKSKAGNMVLQIPGKEKADDLAAVLRRRLGEGIGIRRPSPSVLLVLIGIEDSVEAPELRRALVAFDPELDSIGELTIREGSNGVRTAVIRTPLGPGLKLIRKKRIRVGWAVCRIKEIDKSDASCARCLAKGHRAMDCVGKEKRKCFRCKKQGHLIAACRLPPSVDRAQGQSADPSAAGEDPPPCN